LVNVLAKQFTHDVDDAEEEPITWLRSDVQLAVMGKQPLLRHTRGKQRIFTEKEHAKSA